MSQPDEAPAQAPEYKYDELPDDRSIRMLILRPGAPDSPLEGELEFFNIDSPEKYKVDNPLNGEPKFFNIDSPQKYEALSYVWGDPNRCHKIICAGQPLGLTTSLYYALRRLRHPNLPRRLWVDQICINQKNLDERSQQVQFMNHIYKNASHVLVWLGLDGDAMAEPAFKLVCKLDEIFQDEEKCKEFRTDHTDDLKERSEDSWIPLKRVTQLPWFTRAWIVQEIGTEAPATLFWGDKDIDWKLLHRVCEKLTDYHHLRQHFDIQTAKVKYVFQRFIAPPKTSRHANRFSLMYELHRARHLLATDKRDRVFAMLGHYSVRTGNAQLAALQAAYTKTETEVYVDVAVRALTGDPSLITLAAVQHPNLPTSKEAPNQASTRTRTVDKNTFPSWVPDWETYENHILSEPISPHCAHGTTSPKLKIDRSTLVLSVSGIKFDVIKDCSRKLEQKEFHLNSSSQAPAIKTLWYDIYGNTSFDLKEKYINGESAFFAYTQTLSNGCVATALLEERPYDKIPKSEWLANGAAYVTEALGQSADVSLEIRDEAAKGDRFRWSRAANGASSHRMFAQTAKGYFVLGPKVMEVGDVVCVLFGGKMPFCLRPWGRHYKLVGECYVHGLMGGEAVEMLERREVTEEVFDVI